MSSWILIFGYDEQLLRLRCLVLESQGFHVQTASSLSKANHALNEQDIDVLILCYTLSAADHLSILATVHSVRPEVKILSMDADGSKNTGDDEITVLSNALDGGSFVKAVRDISERRSGSKALASVDGSGV